MFLFPYFNKQNILNFISNSEAYAANFKAEAVCYKRHNAGVLLLDKGEYYEAVVSDSRCHTYLALHSVISLKESGLERLALR